MGADDTAQLIAAAELGDQGRLFLKGDLGRCLIGLSEQDAQTALEELARVDAEDPKAIRKLQNDYYRAVTFKEYLVSLVAEGDNAISVFRQQQE